MSIVPGAIEYATVPGSGLSETRLPIKSLNAILDVVTVVSNPVRYLSRYHLYRNFARHVEASGARLWTVECAYGDRPFEVTTEGNPQHIRVRTDHEIWAKESLLNLGIHRLPRDSQYIAWIDCDVLHTNPAWVQESLQALQHYDIIQTWSDAMDMGPNGEVVVDVGKDGIPRTAFKSFGYSVVNQIPRNADGGSGYYGGVPNGYNTSIYKYFWHPGFAWAARRSALNALGGLFDAAVVGEADWVIAKSLVGEAEKTLYPGVSPGYRKAVLDYQVRAQKLRANFGYISGTLCHFWHGRKFSRKYFDRCKILKDSQFDPTTDLARDCEGLWQLVDDSTPRYVKLRDDIRGYFRQRAEDSMEL